MRMQELHRAIEAEFGALGAVLVDDLTLPGLGGRTAREALASGERARDVWLALCDAKDVPIERRHGVGLREPKG